MQIFCHKSCVYQKNVVILQAELKGAPVMETATRTLQITLPLADVAFLRRQSRNMGWNVVTIRKKTSAEPKVKMTEEEFRAKLAHSSAQGAAGHYVEKLPDETMTQFLDRVCI